MQKIGIKAFAEICSRDTKDGGQQATSGTHFSYWKQAQNEAEGRST